MEWQDLFASGLRLPFRAVIVAPGPNGVGCYDRLPRDGAVIAVSKAVLIPGILANVWMMNHAGQSWFPAADRQFKGTRIFHRDAAEVADQRSRLTTTAAAPRYFFTPPEDPLGLDDNVDVRPGIRIGATVSSCAVQFAFHFGAREILLCGVDMSGDGYFDGTENRGAFHGETWPAVSRFNVLIRSLRDNHGVNVTSLSATKLDVPMEDQKAPRSVPPTPKGLER